MADVPLLERLAQLPAVPISELVDWLASMPNVARDPLLAGFIGVNEEGEPLLHPLLGAVVGHMRQRPEGSCYGALMEALTGIWNAAVRGAVVARLRADGLPPDDLLLRLGQLSPTLGLSSENRDWARQWMADPTARTPCSSSSASCGSSWPCAASPRRGRGPSSSRRRSRSER
jgi:hypothetical protein